MDPFHRSAVAAEALPEEPAPPEPDEEGNVPEAEAYYVPYGSSSKYCAVSLSEGNVVLGKPDFLATYCGRYYAFAGEAQRDQFIASPEVYVSTKAEPSTSEGTAPPPRLMVKGADYSGRSAAVEYLSKVRFNSIFNSILIQF